MAELIFKTSFKDAEKVSDEYLNIPIDHWFTLKPEGARMWVETAFAHSGSRCIGMEIFDKAVSKRNEFNIAGIQYALPDLSDEFTVSAWLMLPEDFSLGEPGWYEPIMFFQESGPTWAPYIALLILQPDIAVSVFNLVIQYEDVDHNLHTLKVLENFPLPRGNWFNIRWYLLRHPTEGILKVWVDKKLIYHGTNLTTKATDNFFITIAKIYYTVTDMKPQQIWVDDLGIWKGLTAFTSPLGWLLLAGIAALLWFKGGKTKRRG